MGDYAAGAIDDNAMLNAGALMNKIDRECARLYARMARFKARVKKTITFISNALDQCQSPYLACSFGKDSAVMLHMVLQVRANIPVRFLRWTGETEVLNDFDLVIEKWLERYPNLNLTQIELSRESTEMKVAGRFGAIEQDSDACFIGLRAQESKGRRATLRIHGDLYRKKDGLLRICPIAWWPVEAIRAYIYEHELPLPESYDHLGIDSRTTSRVPRGNVRDAFFDQLRARDPGAVNVLIKRFPELEPYR